MEKHKNWNVSCLSLLLDADKAYRKRRVEHSKSSNAEEPQKEVGLLEEGDRKLFEQLVAFKILKLNLDTATTALVGWTPEKTKVPIGPLALI